MRYRLTDNDYLRLWPVAMPHQIEEEFGIDVTEVKFKDMVDPKVASLMARLLLKSSATPIPKTLEGQAELWKKEWNSLSELALGTVKQFIRDAKYFGNK